MGSTRSLTSVMNALICLAELSGNLLDDGRAFAFRASASMPVTTRRTFRRSVALRCPAHPLPRPPCLYSSSSAEIYIRRNPTVWVPAGTLGGYGAAVRRFPDATHKLGMKNPGRGMQTIFRNGWNRGTRITLFPHYPMGNRATTLKFGATVLSSGVNNPASTAWTRTYYQQNVGGSCEPATAAQRRLIHPPLPLPTLPD